MDSGNNLQKFAQLINEQQLDNLPPVHLWNPEFTGEMDINISRDGSWSHEGRPIPRESMIRLFASILRKENDGEFYLVTPTEKFQIVVEDAPFVAIEVEIHNQGQQQQLSFVTNLGDKVIADKEHPIWIEKNAGQPRPYLRIRTNLDALISRNLYYQLVEIAQEREVEGAIQFGVCSGGEFFTLG